MSDELEQVRRQMEAASAALDFEEAARLRNLLDLMRGGASMADVEGIDTSGLERQAPGRMGLGTSQQRVVPPPGWKRPQKPGPMTKGRPKRPR